MFSIEKAIVICFIETKEKYLSFGDIKFLLHKKGKLKRYPSKKKEKYKKWEGQFQLNSNHPKIPFRSISWAPNYFSEVLQNMIKKGIIKKVNHSTSPIDNYYYLPTRTKRRDIIRDKHLAVLNHIPDEEIGCFGHITYYGLPHWAVEYPRKTFKRLEKLSEKLRDDGNKFWNIYCEMASVKLKEIFIKIKDGDFNDTDKKLAFRFIKQVLTDHKKIDYHMLLLGNIIETTDFKWTGDGSSLSYLPKKHVLDPGICKLLREFQEKRLFFFNKLIVIEPYPDTKHIVQNVRNTINVFYDIWPNEY